MGNLTGKIKKTLRRNPRLRNGVRWARWQAKKIPGINRASIAIDTAYFKNAGNERPHEDEHSGGDDYSMAYGNFILGKVHGRVLDIGCGHGYLTEKIALNDKVESVVGLDKIVDFQRRHQKITYMTQDFSTSSPSLPGPFDVVVASEFVEHIPEEAHRALLENVVKAMKPGGIYVGSTPLNPTKFKTFSGSRFHVREYTEKDLRTILEYYFVDVIIVVIAEYCLGWEARNPKKHPGPELLFDDAFPKISEQQFEEAKEMAAKVKSIVHARAVRDASGANEPSLIWEAINLFSYTLDPSPEVINSWRLHTQMFTGHDMVSIVEARYQKPSKKMVRRYILRTKGLPQEYIVRAPRVLAECGWTINGGIVNEDMIMYQRHLTTFYFHGIVEYLRSIEHPVIVEIGGGYGALAYYLKKLIPGIQYYLVDLPESLVFSAVYLNTVMPEYMDKKSVYDGKDPDGIIERGDTFTFIPNYLINDLDGKIKADLVINTGSFGEMTEAQVEHYAQFIEKNLGEKGFLYEENQNTYTPVPAILKSRFVYRSFEGQQKNWAKNKVILDAVEEMGRNARESQPWNVRTRREVAERSSRAVRKFPRLKSFVKKIVPH